MGDGDNRYAFAVLAKDHLERIMPHKVIPMPGVAHWKPMRVCGDGFQRFDEFVFKLVGSVNASFRILA